MYVPDSISDYRPAVVRGWCGEALLITLRNDAFQPKTCRTFSSPTTECVRAEGFESRHFLARGKTVLSIPHQSHSDLLTLILKEVE